MTVEELARRSGVTVRNIRAYQSAGLLEAPRRQGRTALYAGDHLARLQTIRTLRAAGLGLDAIRGVVAGAPAESDGQSLALAVSDHLRLGVAPSVLEADELQRRWGAQATPEAIARVRGFGVYRRREDGRYEVLVPAFEMAGAELARLGVPFEVAIDVQERLLADMRAAAAGFVDLLMSHIVPRVLDGEAGGGWSEVAAVVDRMVPLGVEAAAASFRIQFQKGIDEALKRRFAAPPADPDAPTETADAEGPR